MVTDSTNEILNLLAACMYLVYLYPTARGKAGDEEEERDLQQRKRADTH